LAAVEDAECQFLSVQLDLVHYGSDYDVDEHFEHLFGFFAVIDVGRDGDVGNLEVVYGIEELFDECRKI
jgi:hypothetical protein